MAQSGIASAMQAVQQQAFHLRQALQRLFLMPPAAASAAVAAQGAAFADLPTVVLQHVASFLPWRDAQRLSTLVCRSLHGALAAQAALRLAVLNACTAWSLDALQAASTRERSAQCQRLVPILLAGLARLPVKDVPMAAAMLTRHAIEVARHARAPALLDDLVTCMRQQDLHIAEGLLRALGAALGQQPLSLTASARVKLLEAFGGRAMEREHALSVVPDAESATALIRALPPAQRAGACRRLIAGLQATGAGDIARALVDTLHAGRDTDPFLAAAAVTGMAAAMVQSPYLHDLLEPADAPAATRHRTDDSPCGWELILRYSDALPRQHRTAILQTLADAFPRAHRHAAASLYPLAQALVWRADRQGMPSADRLRIEVRLLSQIRPEHRAGAWQALWQRVIDQEPGCALDVIAGLRALTDPLEQAEQWERALGDGEHIAMPAATRAAMLLALIARFDEFPAEQSTPGRALKLRWTASRLARQHGVVEPLARCPMATPAEVLALVASLPATQRLAALEEAISGLRGWTTATMTDALNVLDGAVGWRTPPSQEDAMAQSRVLCHIAQRCRTLPGSAKDLLTIVEDIRMRVDVLWRAPGALEPELESAAVAATAALILLIDALEATPRKSTDADFITERMGLLGYQMRGMLGAQDRFTQLAVIETVYRQARTANFRLSSLRAWGSGLTIDTAIVVDDVCRRVPNGADVKAVFEAARLL